jgi:hypothetical protein
LLFLDDDVALGHEGVVQQGIDVLESSPTIGAVGFSRQIPPDATRFQRKVARTVQRWEEPIVKENTVSNPPLDRFGQTALECGHFLIRRAVFEQAGGFDEGELTTGVDPEFFHRLRSLGYDLVLAANSWAYHEPPTNLKTLLRKHFWYGVGHIHQARKDPTRQMEIIRLNTLRGKLVLLAAALGFPFAFFVHYYAGTRSHLEFGFRPIKTLSTYATLCGYVYGWVYGKPRKPGALLRDGTMEQV